MTDEERQKLNGSLDKQARLNFIARLRNHGGMCELAADEIELAADEIERLVDERDQFVEQLAIRSESGMAKDMQEIMRRNNEQADEIERLANHNKMLIEECVDKAAEIGLLEDKLRVALAQSDAEPVAGGLEIKQAARYAEQLAVSLRAKWYPENIHWKPLSGDLIGLLTQIDNMSTGTVRSITMPQSDAKPVAWRYRWRVNAGVEWTKWREVNEIGAKYYAGLPDHEVQPLYTVSLRSR